MFVRRIFVAALAIAALGSLRSTAGAAPTLGAEIRFDPAAAVNAEGSREVPAFLAQFGDHFFASWVDDRQYRTSAGVGKPSILFARIQSDGTLLDPLGRRLDVAGFGHYPMPGCSRIFCVVVGLKDGAGEAVRIDATGAILGTTRLPWTSILRGYTVSWNGKTFLIAALTTANEVRAVRLDAAGTLLDVTPFLIGTTGNGSALRSSAIEGGAHLVVWSVASFTTSAEDLFAARINDTGVVLDSPAVAVATSSSLEQLNAVAATSSGWLVGYSVSSMPFASSKTPSLARITTSGVVDKRITLPFAPDHPFGAVAWNGTTGLATAWSEAVSLTADGTAGTLIAHSGVPLAYQLAAQPSVFLGLGQETTLVWLTPTGAVTKVDALRKSAPPQRRPVVATHAGGSLVVWTESNGKPSLKYGRIGALGDTPDGSGIALPITGPAFGLHRTASNYTLVARNESSLVAQRIGNDGVANGAPTDFGSTGLDASTAIAGDTLIAATAIPTTADAASATAVHLLVASLVTAPVKGPGAYIDLGSEPQVACGDAGCLLAYVATATTVVTRTVRTDGTVNGPNTITLDAKKLAVAAVDKGFVVVTLTDNTVRALAINKDGAMIGAPVVVSTAALVDRDILWQPTVGSDGAEALIGWFESAWPTTITVARFRGGALIDAPGVAAASVELPNNRASVPLRPSVAGNAGRFMLAYDNFSWLASENAPRIRVRPLKSESSDAGVADADAAGVVDATVGDALLDTRPDAAAPTPPTPDSSGCSHRPAQPRSPAPLLVALLAFLAVRRRDASMRSSVAST